MAPSKPQTRFAFYTALTQCGGPQQTAGSPESAGARRRRLGGPHLEGEEGGGEGVEAAAPPHPPSAAPVGGDDPRSLLVGDAADILHSLAAMEKGGDSRGSVGSPPRAGSQANAHALEGSAPVSAPSHGGTEVTPVHRNPPLPREQIATPASSLGGVSVNGGAHRHRRPRGEDNDRRKCQGQGQRESARKCHDRQHPPPSGGEGEVGIEAYFGVNAGAAASDDGDAASGSDASVQFEGALEDALQLIRRRRDDRQRGTREGIWDGDAHGDDATDGDDFARAADVVVVEKETGGAGEEGSATVPGSDLLSAKQEEWAARRERMAAYACRLEELKGQMQRAEDKGPRSGAAPSPPLPPADTDYHPRLEGTGLGAVVAVSSELASANGSAPPPLAVPPAPPVASASRGDSVLLSPAADVRKACFASSSFASATSRNATTNAGADVDGNGEEDAAAPVFRPPHTPGTVRALAKRPGLELAGPVRSASDAAVTPTLPGVGVDTIPQASASGHPVTPPAVRRSPTPPPSSPLPPPSGDRDRNRAPQSKEDALDRHGGASAAAFEEEVERGIEAVLLAILGRASMPSSLTPSAGREAASGNGAASMEAVVEEALSSVLGGRGRLQRCRTSRTGAGDHGISDDDASSKEGGEEEMMSCGDGGAAASSSIGSSTTGTGSRSSRRGRAARPSRPPRRIGLERSDSNGVDTGGDGDIDSTECCPDKEEGGDAVLAARSSYESDLDDEGGGHSAAEQTRDSHNSEVSDENEDEDGTPRRDEVDDDNDDDDDGGQYGSALRQDLPSAEVLLAAELSPLGVDGSDDEDDGVYEDEVDKEGDDNTAEEEEEQLLSGPTLLLPPPPPPPPRQLGKINVDADPAASNEDLGKKAAAAALAPCVVGDATPGPSDEEMVGVEATILRLSGPNADGAREHQSGKFGDGTGVRSTDEEDDGNEDDLSDEGQDIEIDASSLENGCMVPAQATSHHPQAHHPQAHHHSSGVLGPLSKRMGGTTGIVLTDVNTEEEDEEDEDEEASAGEHPDGAHREHRDLHHPPQQPQRRHSHHLHHQTPPRPLPHRPQTATEGPPVTPASPSLLQSLSDTFLATVESVSPFAVREALPSPSASRPQEAPEMPALHATGSSPRFDPSAVIADARGDAGNDEKAIYQEREVGHPQRARPRSFRPEDAEAAELVSVLCSHLLPREAGRALDDALDGAAGGDGSGADRGGEGQTAAPSSAAAAAAVPPRPRASSADLPALRDAVGAVGSWFGVPSDSSDDGTDEEDEVSIEENEKEDDGERGCGYDGAAGSPASAGAGRSLRGDDGRSDHSQPAHRRRRQRQHRPLWDESDPDESGYVARVLTRAEMRRVESEFDRLAAWVRASTSSESDIRAATGEAAAGKGEDEAAAAAREVLDEEGRPPQLGGDVGGQAEAEQGNDEPAMQTFGQGAVSINDDQRVEEEEEEIDGEGEEVENDGGGDVDDDEDEGFQRDLAEAERLLDEEEKLMEAAKDGEVEKAPATEMSQNVLGDAEENVGGVGIDRVRSDKQGQRITSFAHEDEDSESSECSSDDMSTFEADEDDVGLGHENQDLLEAATGSTSVLAHTTVNPNFPTAFAAGKGSLGDLELFHLPVIYKSQQTGFEPTKDLALTPGSVFAGQYLVQNELGSAAFSTAYRCIDLQSGKVDEDGEEYHEEVCLKVIKNTKDFFDQSLDEIKVLELLRQTGQCHENNIVEMKTFFYHREHLVIVTELLRQNLYEFGKFIAENEEPPYFTRRRLCYITRQMLVSLRFIHRRGLVHSDIKPENILLASYSRARVKLIDFGSSCYLTDRQSSYIQSRSYRAPEVVLGNKYDGKIDVWSLGCVIAEMYTGEVTFQNDSVVTMLSRIEAICGAFPGHLVASGRQSGQFFTASGLLYERVGAGDGDDDSGHHSDLDLDDDDGGDEVQFHVFHPKVTTLAARLGFDADLLERPSRDENEEEKALFVDFVRSLLIVDPNMRPSADEALRHPWIEAFGVSPSDRDIKYPPED